MLDDPELESDDEDRTSLSQSLLGFVGCSRVLLPRFFFLLFASYKPIDSKYRYGGVMQRTKMRFEQRFFFFILMKKSLWAGQTFLNRALLLSLVERSRTASLLGL